MMIKEFVVNFVNSRKTFLVNFVTNRPEKDKQIFLAALVVVFFLVDFFALFQPTLRAFSEMTPEFQRTKSVHDSLRQDYANRFFIEKKWSDLTNKMAETEKSFVAADEMPALLENFSTLALDSRVKIVSLQPLEVPRIVVGRNYGPIPIKISALAGTHELGQFLSRLETFGKLLKVDDVQISSNPADTNRHLVLMDIKGYRKK